MGSKNSKQKSCGRYEDKCCQYDSYDSDDDSEGSSYFSGNFETQISGEYAIDKAHEECQKNPGHKQFIPTTDFSLDHLPYDCRDIDIFKLIKSLSGLTVRVDVQLTTLTRPKFYPGTELPYPFHDSEVEITRTGTGRISGVHVYTEADSKPCPCHTCRLSETPNRVWGEVFVYTATHLVFNDFEAKNTKCVLFYERLDSPLLTLDGVELASVDVAGDRCRLACATCHLDVITTLSIMNDRYNVLWKRVHDRYKSSRDSNRLTVIVSHPHGMPKQISFGQWLHRQEVKSDVFRYTKYTYTACTCPGSAGATVLILGCGLLFAHVHSGCNFDGSNFCGYGWD